MEIKNRTEKMSTYPRTTLFILEKEEWINAKSFAEKVGYNSVSEYVFDLLKADREHKISYYSLLRELEKYYELEHYTLGLTADRAGFSERILINLMQSFGLPFPEEKKVDENLDLIHKLLLTNSLIPREVDSALRLNRELLRRQTLSDADILCSILPNSSERTAEVLTLTRDIVFRLLENPTLKEMCKSCEKITECKRYLDLRSLFGRLALDYDPEALEDDPVRESLSEMNCTQLFGKVLEYSALSIINREMERIENFQSKQNFTLETTEIQEIKARISKRRVQFEKSPCIKMQ